MPTWEQLVKAVSPRTDANGNVILGVPADDLCKKYMQLLSEKTGRNVIAYYSGWLYGRQLHIDVEDNDMTGFVNAVAGLDCSKGLDLILHTPGGYPTAAEGIVNYLHSMFGNDIRVIVPHMAMSAGTMIACSAKSVMLGKHSCLGPVDPQFGGTPAYNIVQEFVEAKEDLETNPNSAYYWNIILRQYPPAFIYKATDAIELSNALVGQWLRQYMFAGESGNELKNKVQRIRNKLNSNNMSHGRHFSYDFCKQLGLNVEEMEADPELFDLIMSAHYSFVIAMGQQPIGKIIQNQNGAQYLAGEEEKEG